MGMKLRIRGSEEPETIVELSLAESINHSGEKVILARLQGPEEFGFVIAWITPEGIRLRKGVPEEYGFARGPAGELAVLPCRSL